MGTHKYAGVGCVYAVPVDADGNRTGPIRKVGNAYPLSVQVTTETQKEISRMCDSAGQILDSKTEITDTNGKLVLRQWNAANLAWALMGQEVQNTDSGGSVTDEAVTAPAAGYFVELDHRNVDNVVITNSDGSVTYQEGVDYWLNKKLGLLEIIDGGSISAGDSLLADYDYAAKAGYVIDLATVRHNRVALMANLTNEFTGDEFTIDLFKVTLSPTNEINFISDPGSEGEVLEFDMVLETPPGKTTPGTVDGIPM